MKKYLSILAILLVISPSIALASWWNPFSWSIFQREKKTEVLENRIKELENRLNNATTTEIGIKNISTTTIQAPVKQVTQTKTTNTQKITAPIVSTTKTEKQEDFKESLVLVYSKSAEEIKRFVDDSRRLDLPELSARRDKLYSVVSKSDSLKFSIQTSDTIIYNQMVDLYIQDHNSEIKFIDDTKTYVEANLKYLDEARIWYKSKATSLLSDSKIVDRATYISALERETNIDSENIYKAQTNLLNAMSKFAQNISKMEDAYEYEYKMLGLALEKMGSVSNKPNITYYQPLPQYNFGLTARQELLLNPIQCKINYDPIQATVTCY